MVSVKEDNEWVVIAVTDNGVGIAADQLDRIWGSFFTTKASEGTGLGLCISKQIVERHGGRIEVASRVGQGSTFTIRLPRAP